MRDRVTTIEFGTGEISGHSQYLMPTFSRLRTAAVVLLALLFPLISLADELFVRVIDVGQGECVVARFTDSTGPTYFIYDAGPSGSLTIAAIKKIIPVGSNVALMVVSHNDSDHIAAIPAIMAAYHIKRIIHPGDDRGGSINGPAKKAAAAIKAEEMNDGCVNTDLSRVSVAPGTYFERGSFRATFIAGFSRPPPDFGNLDESESNNAGSIIIRLSFKKGSILLCGDAVGRHLTSDVGTCIATESYIVNNVANVPIKSDVIVAPHHGANNGSSEDFIAAVAPEYVIFSAGSGHGHPTKAAAKRYTNFGVPLTKIFRTDLGDSEGGNEWAEGAKADYKDGPGDHHVDIVISDDQNISVAYAR